MAVNSYIPQWSEQILNQFQPELATGAYTGQRSDTPFAGAPSGYGTFSTGNTEFDQLAQKVGQNEARRQWDAKYGAGSSNQFPIAGSPMVGNNMSPRTNLGPVAKTTPTLADYNRAIPPGAIPFQNLQQAMMFGTAPAVTSDRGSSAGGSGTGSFNLNPAPQGGNGPFGAVPGPVGSPDPFGDLAAVYPNLSGTNAAVSGQLASQLAGELSPSTIAAIQDAAARFGVGSGMPGSGLSRNRTVRDLGLTTEGQVQRGLSNYGGIVSAIKGTQTVSPELQYNIADRNSVYGAAPDPTQAAAYSKQLYDQYLARTRGAPNTRGGGRGWTPSFTPNPAGGTLSNTAAGFPSPSYGSVNPNMPSYGYASNNQGGYASLFQPNNATYGSPGEVPYQYEGNPSDLVRQPAVDWGYEPWMQDYLD